TFNGGSSYGKGAKPCTTDGASPASTISSSVDLASLTPSCGGGGGGTDSIGGRGGGLVVLLADTSVTLYGRVDASGASGTSTIYSGSVYGGGSGAGGVVYVGSPVLRGTGSILAPGGDSVSGGGKGSGAGGGGLIILDISTSDISSGLTVSVAGGSSDSADCISDKAEAGTVLRQGAVSCGTWLTESSTTSGCIPTTLDYILVASVLGLATVLTCFFCIRHLVRKARANKKSVDREDSMEHLPASRSMSMAPLTRSVSLLGLSNPATIGIGSMSNPATIGRSVSSVPFESAHASLSRSPSTLQRMPSQMGDRSMSRSPTFLGNTPLSMTMSSAGLGHPSLTRNNSLLGRSASGLNLGDTDTTYIPALMSVLNKGTVMAGLDPHLLLCERGCAWDSDAHPQMIPVTSQEGQAFTAVVYDVALRPRHIEDLDTLVLKSTLVQHESILPTLDFSVMDTQVVLYVPRLSQATPSLSALPPSDRIKYACVILASVAKGVSLMHSQEMVHGCLSPTTVLLHDRRGAMLDMGVSRLVEEITHPDELYLGTPGYVAPELLDEMPSPASDVYALGSLMAYLFGADLSPGISSQTHLAEALAGEEYVPSQLDGGLFAERKGSGIRNLISDCWLPDPAARPSAAMVAKVMQSLADMRFMRR
ncbi:hypothetical protein KIPB_009237, partial [Kipferlia bialata]